MEKKPLGPRQKRVSVNPMFVLLIAMGLLYLFSRQLVVRPGAAVIPYSQFLSYIDERKVSEVTMNAETIQGELKQAPQGQPKFFSVNRLEDPGLTQALKVAGVKFSGTRESGGSWGSLLGAFLPWIILIGIWSYIIRRSAGMQRGGRILSLGKSKAKIYVETDLKTRFEDVAGIDEVKEDLREVVHFLREPKRYSTLGDGCRRASCSSDHLGQGRHFWREQLREKRGFHFSRSMEVNLSRCL